MEKVEHTVLYFTKHKSYAKVNKVSCSTFVKAFTNSFTGIERKN